MEVLLRRYDDPKNCRSNLSLRAKAAGVSICFWADDSNQIVMETGTKNATGGNVWKTAKSGVTPLKDVYYHIVAVWDKAAGTQKIYVDGELKATNNSAGGEFRHMNTNVDKRWFGIGARPQSQRQGADIIQRRGGHRTHLRRSDQRRSGSRPLETREVTNPNTNAI